MINNGVSLCILLLGDDLFLGLSPSPSAITDLLHRAMHVVGAREIVVVSVGKMMNMQASAIPPTWTSAKCIFRDEEVAAGRPSVMLTVEMS